MIDMQFHFVEKIELVRSYVDNGNSRTIRITSNKGEKTEVVFYGETDALDALPKSDDYYAVGADKQVAA